MIMYACHIHHSDPISLHPIPSRTIPLPCHACLDLALPHLTLHFIPASTIDQHHHHHHYTHPIPHTPSFPLPVILEISAPSPSDPKGVCTRPPTVKHHANQLHLPNHPPLTHPSSCAFLDHHPSLNSHPTPIIASRPPGLAPSSTSQHYCIPLGPVHPPPALTFPISHHPSPFQHQHTVPLVVIPSCPLPSQNPPHLDQEALCSMSREGAGHASH
ncbi:hypothetical protein CC79DRAFT_1166696 [Sarocladium strictum]